MCSRRILPPRSVLPKFLISKPSVITTTTTTTTLADDEIDSYYDDAGSARSWYPPTPPKGRSSTTFTEARDPFSDHKQHPNEHSEAVIRRVHSPNSERSSSRASRRSLSEAGDHSEMREVSLSPASQWSSAPESEEEELAEDEMISHVPTHHEGERTGRPHTPHSALHHH